MSSRPIPLIEQYMTPSPTVIASDMSLHDARKIMEEHNIRHLPIVQAGRLVGMVTDRDLQVLEPHHRLGIKTYAVSAVMRAPLVVSPQTPLDEVVSQLLAKRACSAIVSEQNAIVGIFTAVDSLEALNDSLRNRLPVPRPVRQSA